MGYHLKRDETAVLGIRRIVCEQIDKARTDLKHTDAVEAVHEFRKRCKKIRAALHLVRPALGKQFKIENARFRDMARRVSGVRDTQVMVETYDKLLEAYANDIDRRHYAPLRRKLLVRSEASVGSAVVAELGSLDSELGRAGKAVSELTLKNDDFEAIAGGLGKTYRRARKRRGNAYKHAAAESFHEWRKRVKYHRYHCDLLRGTWPEAMKVRRVQLKHLSDLLGDEHDLAVLDQQLRDPDMPKVDSRNREPLLSMIDHRRVVLQRAAKPMGMRLFAERDDPFVERIGIYWCTWKVER